MLVNTAGITFTKVGEEEEFDRLFARNAKGAYFCCQEAVRRKLVRLRGC